jgi:uncharacterized protein
MKLTSTEKKEYDEYLQELMHDPYLLRMKCFVHHHKMRTFDHVVRVAEEAYKIAQRLPGKVDMKSLLRGAMLHDYYLYNWRDHELWHYHHIKKHPKIAYVNACRDFDDLNSTEKDIILHHMWPHPFLALPRTREAWIVMMADKIVSPRDLFYKGPKIVESVEDQNAAFLALPVPTHH